MAGLTRCVHGLEWAWRPAWTLIRRRAWKRAWTRAWTRALSYSAAAAVASLLAALPPVSAAAQERDPLARARLLYNGRQFDAAIALAQQVRTNPARADSADLVAARAYLERYRESHAADDLTTARERLRSLDPQRLGQRERVEFLVGLGETLFLEAQSAGGHPPAETALASGSTSSGLTAGSSSGSIGGSTGGSTAGSMGVSTAAPTAGPTAGSYGAAAELFGSILSPSQPVESLFLPVGGRERLLDWWASSLDQDARTRTAIERQMIYQRIRDRMHEEIAAHPGSSAASFWLAAAARAQGDWQSAWDAAVAGWIRAGLAPDRGVEIRSDLDSLVRRTIVPEWARAQGVAVDELLARWNQLTQSWSK